MFLTSTTSALEAKVQGLKHMLKADPEDLCEGCLRKIDLIPARNSGPTETSKIGTETSKQPAVNRKILARTRKIQPDSKKPEEISQKPV